MSSSSALLLSGCVSVEKRSINSIELPNSFTITGDVQHNIAWWKDFNDPNLTEVIASSLPKNFTIQTAYARLKEKEAALGRDSATLWPELEAKGGASSTRDYEKDNSSESFLLELAASYELDLWGRLKHQKQAALLERTATEADYHSAVISVTSEIATTWYQRTNSFLQRELLSEQKKVNKKILQLITVKVRSGQSNIADILQQRQLIASTKAEIIEVNKAQKQYDYQLAILMGVSPGTISLPLPKELPELPPLPELGIPLKVITNRPDIMSSFRKLQASDNRVAAAVADRFPRLSISVDYYTSGERSRDLFNNWFSSFAANLVAPIFDGGKKKSIVAEKRAVTEQNLYRHGQNILEAIVEVENALLQEQSEQKKLENILLQLQLTEDTLYHVTNRYRQGAEDYLRVLSVLLSHQSLQRNVLTVRKDLILARIKLYRAISGPILIQAKKIGELNTSKNTDNRT